VDGKRRASVLEVQSVAAPNPRSWFLNDEQVIEGEKVRLVLGVIINLSQMENYFS
jgi:hypothetical protein